MKKVLATATAIVLASFGLAQADVSKRVQKAFRGQILITAGPLPASAATDKATIKKFKKARAKAIKHAMSGEDVPEWSFHFTAFMKKLPKVKSLSFDFYTDDKEKLYVANKRLMGITPNVPILSGTITMSEDDNLNKGRKYIVKLTGEVRGREVVYASSKIKLE